MSRTLRAAGFLFAITALSVGVLATARADGPPEPADATLAAPVDLQNKTCPVTGTAVAPGVTATVDGVIVHFCCPRCPAKYKANPAAFQTALRADPAVAARLDAAKAAAGANPEPPHIMGTPPELRPSTEPVHDGPKGAAFHDAMRVLWSDHVAWTRHFLVSALAGLPDADAAKARLLKNQEDLGNAIKPHYGEEAGKQLTGLLKDHIAIAAELALAAAADDEEKVAAAQTKWTANSDEIARFLSKANPKSWPLDALSTMFREHLAVTTEQVKARVAKDWEADIAAYEKVHAQAMHMADMLSDGIRRQFPESFK